MKIQNICHALSKKNTHPRGVLRPKISHPIRPVDPRFLYFLSFSTFLPQVASTRFGSGFVSIVHVINYRNAQKNGSKRDTIPDTTCLYYRFLAHSFFLLRSSEDKVRTVFIILVAEFSVEINTLLSTYCL